MDNDNTIEQEIQRKGKTAPRITPDDIEGNISACHFLNAGTAVAAVGTTPHVEQILQGTDAEQLLTICVITLRNGFTVTGVSACASPENFDREIGERIARANAVQQIWPLMGYELKQRLHSGEQHLLPYCNKDLQPYQQRVVIELGELQVKRKALDVFLASDLFDRLDDTTAQLMLAQCQAMTDYANALSTRIDNF